MPWTFVKSIFMPIPFSYSIRKHLPITCLDWNRIYRRAINRFMLSGGVMQLWMQKYHLLKSRQQIGSLCFIVKFSQCRTSKATKLSNNHKLATYNNENFHTLCFWVSSLRYLNCSIYCAVFHDAVSSLILEHSITHTATLRAIISVYGNITLLLWIFHSFLMQLWWVCWSFVVQMWVQRVAIVTWKPNDCCTFNFQQSFSRFLFKTKAIKNNNVIISLFHGECIKSRL